MTLKWVIDYFSKLFHFSMEDRAWGDAVKSPILLAWKSKLLERRLKNSVTKIVVCLAYDLTLCIIQCELKKKTTSSSQEARSTKHKWAVVLVQMTSRGSIQSLPFCDYIDICFHWILRKNEYSKWNIFLIFSVAFWKIKVLELY